MNFHLWKQKKMAPLSGLCFPWLSDICTLVVFSRHGPVADFAMALSVVVSDEVHYLISGSINW